MSFAVFIGILSISFVMSISPGPVNIMIVTSGINHGFKRTFAFISGATIGFTLLLILIAFGLFQLMQDFPNFMYYIKLLGALFMIYLGYKIAFSHSKLHVEDEIKVPKFYEGFLLQWLNPKAWAACVSTVSLFSSNTQSLIALIVIYFVVCYLSLSFWGVLGQSLMNALNNTFRLRIFNALMGLLLVGSAISLLMFQGGS